MASMSEGSPGKPQENAQEKNDGQSQGDGFFHGNLLSPNVLANNVPPVWP
jgi:hypothetical protein